MKLKRRWNERTRLILILELAVVLPAAALVIFSGLHLQRFKRDRAIEAAIQRDFNQVLAISEKHINHKAVDLVDDATTSFPRPGNVCTETLDRILAAHPYVAHAFLYDPMNGMVFRSQPSRLREPDFRAEAAAQSKMYEGWIRLEFDEFFQKLQMLEKKGTRYYASGQYVARGDKHLYQPAYIFTKVDDKTGAKAIGAVLFDAEYVQDHFLPEVLEGVMSHNVAEGQGEHAVMMIHPRSDSTPLAACAGWDGGVPEVERNLELVLEKAKEQQP